MAASFGYRDREYVYINIIYPSMFGYTSYIYIYSWLSLKYRGTKNIAEDRLKTG